MFRSSALSLALALTLAISMFGQDGAGPTVAERKLDQSGSTPSLDSDEQLEREEYYRLLMTLADTIDQIDRNYVEKVSRRELVEAAIDGALRKLDPYSNYIAPEEMDEFKTEVENEFGGVGLQITVQRGQLVVMSPVVDSPAYRAGIIAGDQILQIDGVATKGMSIHDAIKKMKGPSGTKVSLTLFHPYRNEREEVELVRDRIQVRTVLGDQRDAENHWNYMYDRQRKIAYVRITMFGRETSAELREVIEALQRKGMRGLVLDLRFNPGGLLRSAIEVADLFLVSGNIVSTQGRNVQPQSWDAHAGDPCEDTALVVLVNQFSASASEIVAAALQDHARAIVVGEQTYGKASIQNVVELEGGQSALKLTTGSYQRPSGKPIHRFPDATEWGVQANAGFEVKLANAEVAELIERRRARDVVQNKPTLDDANRRQIEDRQLERAVEYLRNLLPESD